jgi:hypothetical protein
LGKRFVAWLDSDWLRAEDRGSRLGWRVVGHDKLDRVAPTRKRRRGQGKLRAAARMLCAGRKKENHEKKKGREKRKKKKGENKFEKIFNSDF